MPQKLKAWCKACNSIATTDCLKAYWHAEQIEERDYTDEFMLDLERGYTLVSYYNYTITGEAIYSLRYESL
jgi:hypothetical protein